jgi:hypothetical protein
VSAESLKLRTLGVRGSLGAGEVGLGCARKRPGRYADSSVRALTIGREQVRGTCSTGERHQMYIPFQSPEWSAPSLKLVNIQPPPLSQVSSKKEKLWWNACERERESKIGGLRREHKRPV